MNSKSKRTESLRKLLDLIVLRINNKHTRKVLFILILPIFVTGTIVGTLTIIRNTEEQRKWKMREDFEVQNFIFRSVIDQTEKYHEYNPVSIKEPTIDGIDNWTYIHLVLYKNETGNTLTFDHVIDYLSKEFEEDGGIRIYTNGKHPEIADFIEWAYQGINIRLRADYGVKLSFIYMIYSSEAREHQAFPTCDFLLLPVEMVDELIKKEADPDYELDLISIQNRYIQEGRARVLDDETIEYIIPEQTLQIR